MQVLRIEPGYAVCEGRGEKRRVTTALVGDVVVGDWVLIFLNDAREIIDAQRAAEVNMALNWVQDAMGGAHLECLRDEDIGFMLPSQMNLQDLKEMTGEKP
jgi:hydrogenase expression/formation protein HypC